VIGGNPAGSTRLAVVIPAYNEQAGVEKTCRSVLSELDGCEEFVTLVLVDDGSTDDTAQTVRSFAAKEPRLHLLERRNNGGYGAALREGAALARSLGCTHAVFMDSDLTNRPSEIPALLERFSSDVRYVKASRFVQGGGMRGVPAWRASISWLGSKVARLLMGTQVRDVTNGFRGVELAMYSEWNLREPGFAVIMEEMEIVTINGISVAEFPSVLGTRGPGLRGTSFRIGPGLLASYLRYPLRVLRWRVQSRLSLVTDRNRGD